MKKSIIGGIITLVIGGVSYSISQSDVVNNFSKDTGLSHEQAQDYVQNAQNNLDTFSNTGDSLIADGSSALGILSQIDCDNYTYNWESPNLTCPAGSNQLLTIGNNETKLGNCYKSLDTNLGDTASTTIRRCIEDIDILNASLNLPIATKLLNRSDLTEISNTNSYNKAVLQAALK